MKKLIQVSAMVGVIITLLAITAVQSYAGDLIYACISKSGQIRIVSATDSCRNNESSVQWENGELGLNSVYNNWVTSQGPGTRAEAYSRCMDGDILLSGGCYCVPEPTSDCLTVLEISKPVYNDIDQDGVLEDRWKCSCVNPLGTPCAWIGVQATARCLQTSE